MPSRLPILLILLFTATLQPAIARPSDATIRQWIEEMKEAPRGPFSGIKWFCKDGQILDPEPFACEEFGGGVQHGQWSKRTQQIREAGYPIANVLADLKPDDVVPPGKDQGFRFLLLEKFLISYDDGWILRKAQYYRGAFQTHNEWESAQAILETLTAQKEWQTQRYPMLFEAVRLLPHGAESQSLLTRIRGLSSVIAEKQSAFAEIRNKIHISPDASDAQRVRDFAADKGNPEQKDNYEALAAAIDQAYGDEDLVRRLDRLIVQLRGEGPAGDLKKIRAGFDQKPDALQKVILLGDLLETLRRRLPDIPGPKRRLLAVDTAVVGGVSLFTNASVLRQELAGQPRDAYLAGMIALARGLYGVGLISERELAQIRRSVHSLRDETPDLARYRRELELLGRVPGWATRGLEARINDVVEIFARIEPKARMYVADRLRGSPMLAFALLHEALSQDANRLAGVQHLLFGNSVPSGLRALNPGLARGELRHADELGRGSDPADGIYLVPETTPDLPAVAGILTESEGNALSHVQLLARNLGVPNVVVANERLPALLARMGERIIVAASPGGVVHIREDSGDLDALFAARDNQPAPIRIDLDKLDLKSTAPIPVTSLTARDSGRRVGPKAAHVAELAHRFPGTVAPGIAIPFGVYRKALQQPAYDKGPSMFDWMRDQLRSLQAQRKTDPAGHQGRLSDFLSRVRGWFSVYEFDDGFVRELRRAMDQVFGEDGSYGVFVRSDTNIEDLDGFTGAGLNKTVPNVVGFENILDGIKQVWASPFTERAFSWRQGQMDRPEHVYVSVLLHRSVAADKSGVMITSDVETGDPDWLTVVASPGVGGGVDGQSGEEVRIRISDGKVRLMAQATQSKQRILNPEGGVSVIPVPPQNRVLDKQELKQLVEFARLLPERFPEMIGEDAETVVDVEYGFREGKLILFQIRPFVQSNWTGFNDYLGKLDVALNRNAGKPVNMQEPPLR